MIEALLLNNISPVDNLLCVVFVFVGSLAIFAKQLFKKKENTR